MAVSVRGVVTVLLPGTGSDDDYLLRALGGPLDEAGAVVRAVRPDPGGVVNGYLRTLEEASRDGPIALGGISLGAAVAAQWALAHPESTVAVLAVLPPWTGAPDDAGASVSARHTAALLRHDGLAATAAAMRASSPAWLGEELTRSWTRQWPGLPDAMEEAAAYVAPSAEELERLRAPLGVVAATDDLIHPLEVAVEWATAAPRAALRKVRLADFGPRPRLLGDACVAALAAID
ncbi:MAG: alpha/beta hydrolase [Mycobacterium sp.]